MKRMRNIFLFIILGVLSMSFIDSNAQAAGKAGATCKKLGALAQSGGYTYTCIKLSKKLVWSKGFKAVKPTPTPKTSARA